MLKIGDLAQKTKERKQQKNKAGFGNKSEQHPTEQMAKQHVVFVILALDKLDFRRRRTERIRRERIECPLTNDMENRRRPRANSQSDPIRRGRGRPKTVGLKKQEEEKGKISHVHRYVLWH